MGFLLLFDLTNEQSFLNVRNWISECCSPRAPVLIAWEEHLLRRGFKGQGLSQEW